MLKNTNRRKSLHHPALFHLRFPFHQEPLLWRQRWWLRVQHLLLSHHHIIRFWIRLWWFFFGVRLGWECVCSHILVIYYFIAHQFLRQRQRRWGWKWHGGGGYEDEDEDTMAFVERDLHRLVLNLGGSVVLPCLCLPSRVVVKGMGCGYCLSTASRLRASVTITKVLRQTLFFSLFHTWLASSSHN